MYHKGQGVKQDYPKAMEYYVMSANQGNTKAQESISMFVESTFKLLLTSFFFVTI